jgi:hypothetical protein
MDLFYELIQVSLGRREILSRTPSTQEWSALYKESKRQAILGVMLMGIEKLPETQRPPKNLLLSWIGIGEFIRHQNKLVNKRCLQLIKILKDVKIRYCILKGQGNAMMYPNPCCRNAGDIDVWLDGGKKNVVEYVHSIYPDINVQYHHMNFPVFDDVEVEVHYFPSFCYNKFYNRRLQKYFRENSAKQFEHMVKWNDSDEMICVPTLPFNLVFQLSHMMRHFFTQGIGLRHAIDYYYLLYQDISEEQKRETVDVMKKCGMYKFFCALMWIEKEMFGLSTNLDIAPVNEKAGKMVLQEMMAGGNFGKNYGHNKGDILSVFSKQMLYRLKFIREFPSEPLWRPFTLVWDYIKKRV